MTEIDLDAYGPTVRQIYELATKKIGGTDEPLYGGEVTFQGLERSQELDGVDIAVLGCPYDLGTTYRPGARFGPRSVRELSRFVGAWPMGVWPWDDNIRDEFRIIDYGDVPYVTGYWDSFRDSATMVADRILSSGSSLLSIGGDHYVAHPLMAAHAKHHGPLAVVHFDSHSDDLPVPTHNHGTMFFHGIHEGLVDPSVSMHLGLRTPYPQSTELGYEVLDAIAIREMTSREIARAIADRVGDRPAYLTFDIDFIDPAFAPGTGTPCPGGPDVYKSREILFELDETGVNVVGGDMVEVAPIYDGPGQITALAGATIASDILELIAHSRARSAAS